VVAIYGKNKLTHHYPPMSCQRGLGGKGQSWKCYFPGLKQPDRSLRQKTLQALVLSPQILALKSTGKNGNLTGKIPGPNLVTTTTIVDIFINIIPKII
jgi:hypothetical protein